MRKNKNAHFGAATSCVTHYLLLLLSRSTARPYTVGGCRRDGCLAGQRGPFAESVRGVAAAGEGARTTTGRQGARNAGLCGMLQIFIPIFLFFLLCMCYCCKYAHYFRLF